MPTTFFEWTKKLGQQHFSMGGGSTLCGMPMLGNNYARDYYDEDNWVDNLEIIGFMRKSVADSIYS